MAAQAAAIGGGSSPAASAFRIPKGPAPSGNRSGPLACARHGTAPRRGRPPPSWRSRRRPRWNSSTCGRSTGINRAQDRYNLDAWGRWAKGFASDERQRDALEDAHLYNLERVAVAASRRAAIAT
jgi:hypothetical protein